MIRFDVAGGSLGLAVVDLGPAAAELQRRIRGRFDTKTAPDGTAWKPWSPAYAETRGSGHSLLVDTGELRNDVTAEDEGMTISVYSSLPYAAAQNEEREFVGASSADLVALEQLILDGFNA